MLFYAFEKLLVLLLSPVINQGRVILDLRQAADDLCQFRKIMLSHVAMARFG